tara:strand:+ start:1682 stop:1906 length:225 start_codon:yes stop_codon:yes gene_type:complete
MDYCLKKNKKKNENNMSESLLEDIELKPYSISKDLTSDFLKKKIIYPELEKVPWQFFLDTHTHRDDIGWWKNKL